jgi:molybdate-binding protein/DNA-binding XRE family transcriptional regulator
MLARRMSAQISQGALAARCGISRQFINVVESGRTQPNVAIALKIATALGTTVEVLFGGAAPTGDFQVRLEPPGQKPGARVNLARPGREWVAFAADTLQSIDTGFCEADAMLLEVSADGATGRVRLARGREVAEVEANIVVAGCDPALALLGGARIAPGLPGRCFWVNRGSGRALDLLAAHRVHIAGIHTGGSDGAENLEEIAHLDPAGRWQVFRFTCWEQGWMLRPGLRKGFSGAADFSSEGWRIANREPGAGSRRWLDEQLARAILPAKPPGYEREFSSHWECARELLAGTADVAVGPRAVAKMAGLDFVSAGDVAFDLVIARPSLALPRVAALLEALCGKRLRDEIESLPGYRATEAGLSVERRKN